MKKRAFRALFIVVAWFLVLIASIDVPDMIEEATQRETISVVAINYTEKPVFLEFNVKRYFAVVGPKSTVLFSHTEGVTDETEYTVKEDRTGKVLKKGQLGMSYLIEYRRPQALETDGAE